MRVMIQGDFEEEGDCRYTTNGILKLPCSNQGLPRAFGVQPSSAFLLFYPLLRRKLRSSLSIRRLSDAPHQGFLCAIAAHRAT